ncbi:hypothetical protein V6N13_127022 [Hibiscus sabdariffa]
MEAFLSQNPSEIITIMIEDYVHTTKGLSNLFTGAVALKEAEEGIAYQWKYILENEACQEHSAPPADMIGTCFKAAGSMLPNFIAINFYMKIVLKDTKRKPSCHCVCKTTIFPSFSSDLMVLPSNLDNSTDMMNFKICLVLVHVGAPFGSYKNISMPSTSPMTSSARSFSGSVQFSKSTSAVAFIGVYEGL